MNSEFRFFTSIVTLCLASLGPLVADLKPAKIFGSGMVLQQEQPIKIWGTASSGEVVKIIFAGDTERTKADSDGNWSVSFPARKASFDPVTLQINEHHFDDILIGEVWILSGQSNMQWALEKIDGGKALDTENSALRLCRHDPLPNISKKGYGPKELARCNTRDFWKFSWTHSDGKTAMKFSGVGWPFGNQLQEKLNVPVGLIQVALGGSAMNSWLPENVARAHPVTKDFYTSDWFSNERVNINHRKRGRVAFQHILKEGEPYLVGKTEYRWLCEPDFLFESGIAPLQGLGFKGVLWYQGEADAGTGQKTQDAAQLLPALIESWRAHFGQGDFPFLFVQLPGFKAESWPAFREMQRQTEKSVPNTGMVVTFDLGNKKNIHPKDKLPVADRAARLALKDAYGDKDVSGFPQVASVQQSGGAVAVQLDIEPSKLKSVRGNIPGFEVAGADGQFVPAKAKLTSPATVTLQSSVSTPAQVRYGWQPYPTPKPVLYTEDGLPLGPFVKEL